MRSFKLSTIVMAVIAIMFTVSFADTRDSASQSEVEEKYVTTRIEIKNLLQQIYEEQRAQYEAKGEYLYCDGPEDFDSLGVHFPDSLGYLSIDECEIHMRPSSLNTGNNFYAVVECNFDNDSCTEYWYVRKDGIVRQEYDDLIIICRYGANRVGPYKN